MSTDFIKKLQSKDLTNQAEMNAVFDLIERRLPKVVDAAPVNAVEATGKITFSGVVIDGETVTVGEQVYEFDGDGSITEGSVQVDVSGAMTASQGTLSLDTQPTANDLVTVGDYTYVFVADGDEGNPGEISIGADLAEAQTNLVAAINGTDGVHTANAYVTAAAFSGNDCILTAKVPGTAGDALETTETLTAVAAVAQVEEITCVADVTDSLDGTYFQLSDSAGTVGVWIDTDDSGTTIPAGASALDRAIEVTGVVTDDTDAAVATAVAAAIHADSEFTATATDAVVTVTQATAGRVADGVDGDAGFSFSVAADGKNASGFDGTALGTTTAGVDCPAADAETALVAAITGDANAVVTAAADTGADAVDVEAIVASVDGNSIATTETCANAAWGAANLTGGVSGDTGYAMEQRIYGTDLYINKSNTNTTINEASWYKVALTAV